MEKESLIETDNDYIRLTERGIDLSNYVFAEFITPIV
jgi:coproporphyrinogen III oxidase-like Fe-S oxidoreductase